MLGRQNVSPTLQQQVNHSSQQRASLFQQTWKVSVQVSGITLICCPSSKSGCLHKWSDLLMFPSTEQRIVVLKCILLLPHCLYTFPAAPSSALGIFHRSNWNIPAAAQSRALTGCNSVLRAKKTLADQMCRQCPQFARLMNRQSVFGPAKHQPIIPRTLQKPLGMGTLQESNF